MQNKKIVICGITGNIGQQTVEVCRKLKFKIVGCSYFNEHKLCKKIIKNNNIKHVLCCYDNEYGNCQSFTDLLKKTQPDLVVNAIVGFAGLQASIATLTAKIDLALANKESLVVAGYFIDKLAKKNHVKVLPIDSEHTSLMNLVLLANKPINQLYITCSGGFFLTYSTQQKKSITWQQATKHPNWNMGEKITIDSNTLLNKCFEIIEAYWYFHTKKINVLLDPTSNVHSAIMFDDGGLSLSKCKSDMHYFIALAINDFKSLKAMKSMQENAKKTNNLALMDKKILPLKWAYDVINDKTKSLGVILNAANEAALYLFKTKKISFDKIVSVINFALLTNKPKKIARLIEIKKIYESVYANTIVFYCSQRKKSFKNLYEVFADNGHK